jgi:hypothetical protein
VRDCGWRSLAPLTIRALAIFAVLSSKPCGEAGTPLGIERPHIRGSHGEEQQADNGEDDVPGIQEGRDEIRSVHGTRLSIALLYHTSSVVGAE